MEINSKWSHPILKKNAVLIGNLSQNLGLNYILKKNVNIEL